MRCTKGTFPQHRILRVSCTSGGTYTIIGVHLKPIGKSFTIVANISNTSVLGWSTSYRVKWTTRAWGTSPAHPNTCTLGGYLLYAIDSR